MRERLSSSNNCGKAGSRHWLHVSTSLSSPRWITVSHTRRCLQLPRFSNRPIFLQLRIKIEEGKVRVEKCSHEIVLRAKHLETKHRTQFSPLSSTPRKCHETQQKRQSDVHNSQKITQTHGKNENLIDQKRVLIRRKV